MTVSSFFYSGVARRASPFVGDWPIDAWVAAKYLELWSLAQIRDEE